jgi:hypothetical protein
MVNCPWPVRQEQTEKAATEAKGEPPVDDYGHPIGGREPPE